MFVCILVMVLTAMLLTNGTQCSGTFTAVGETTFELDTMIIEQPQLEETFLCLTHAALKRCLVVGKEFSTKVT
jgi:hypothetical protein